MSRKQKILFVSHEASPTGAPLLLLGLHQWLKNHMDLDSAFLLKLGGSIAAKFSQQAKTYQWDLLRPKSDQHIRFLLNRLRKLYIAMSLKHQQFDIVYLNSAFCSDILPALKKFRIGKKVIMHVHELGTSIETFCKDDFEQALPFIDHFIAVSENAQHSLMNQWNIPANKISLIHPCSYPRQHFIEQEDIQKKHNISPNTFIVGGCGDMGQRKGTDLFIECAKHFFQNNPQANVLFLWLGPCKQPELMHEYETSIREYGLTDNVLFAGEQSNSGDYFTAFDLFLLTSREDPFPLVALENAQAGNPIICFNQHNGCTEYVNSQCGNVVDYEQTDLMAKAVERFYNNRNDLASASQLIRQQVKPYSPGTTGNAVKDLLNSMQQTGEV